MTRPILLSVFAMTLTAIAAAAGCGDDNKASTETPSGDGESCTRTSDCKSGLSCFHNTCTATETTDGGKTRPAGSGGQGGAPGSGGATAAGGAAPQPAVLGEEGESCTRRADCAAGLVCVLQTCSTGGTSVGGGNDGGVPPTPLPTLGQRGESCQSVRDCADGLTCIPRTAGSGGICDLEKYGLEPTGKACGGECNKAADCCELPPNVLLLDTSTGFSTLVRSCQDILEGFLDGDATICDATPPPAKDPACFYYKAYCTCAASTWTCTESRCIYAARCTKDADVFKGCPTRTRTGGPTVASTCDTTASKCQAIVTGCATATECETMPVYDDSQDTCQKDECTCVDKKCYRKCDEDLDCPQRYTCETKRSVCVPAGACAANPECTTQLGDVRAECRDGKCVLPCANDHECSGSGLVGGTFTSRVCSNAGVCESLGCATDDECATGGGIRTFCVAPAAAAARAIRSAITD